MMKIDTSNLARPRFLDGAGDPLNASAQPPRRREKQQPLALLGAARHHVDRMNDRRILVFSDYYLPGFKAGGSIRSLSAIVTALTDRYEFFVMTRDRDAGDEGPYRRDLGSGWHDIEGCRCRYFAPTDLRFRRLRDAIRTTPHEVQYVNSLFSWPLSIKPIVLRRLGLVPDRPLVLAPRGELGPGALRLRPTRKRVYIALARVLRLYGSVIWHAADEDEAVRIRQWFGGHAQVHVAPDVVAPVAIAANRGRSPEPLQTDALRIAFMSRISPIKNLDGALKTLAGVDAEVQFDVYGPVEDGRYWSHCERLAAVMPPNVRFAYHGPLRHDRIGPTLGGYNLFLLPSRGESFGHAIFEALSAGCPVLISDRTPWRGLEADHAGWDIPLEDVQGFRTVIESQAAASAAERGVWARGAALRAHKYVSTSDSTGRIAQLLETALLQSRGASYCRPR